MCIWIHRPNYHPANHTYTQILFVNSDEPSIFLQNYHFLPSTDLVVLLATLDYTSHKSHWVSTCVTMSMKQCRWYLIGNWGRKQIQKEPWERQRCMHPSKWGKDDSSFERQWRQARSGKTNLRTGGREIIAHAFASVIIITGRLQATVTSQYSLWL